MLARIAGPGFVNRFLEGHLLGYRNAIRISKDIEEIPGALGLLDINFLRRVSLCGIPIGFMDDCIS